MEHSFRPTDEDAAVINITVSRILEPVQAWFQDHGRRDYGLDKIETDLADALMAHHDGYGMAKFLERSAGWTDVNAELVAILQGARETLDAVSRSAIREWVKATNLRPAHKIGDRVKYGSCEGRILRIRAEDGLYEFVSDEHEGRFKGGFVLTDKIPFEEIDGAQ